jgi:hypothetical protein
MEQDQYVKVNIKESTRTKLKDQARTKGMTLADYIEWLGANVSAKPIADEADQLLEQLDNKYENPTVDPLLEGLAPGELPECCQGIYDDPERPVPTCEHWEKAWVNHYGNKVVHYKNKLTGGSYFDYFNTYVN